MFDAHAHLTLPRIYPDAEHYIARLQDRGLTGLLLAGVDAEDWQRQLTLKARQPNFVHMAFGIHPWTVQLQSHRELEVMFEQLRSMIDRAIALGELGIDCSQKLSTEQKAKQELWFERQLVLAKEKGKPVVIHAVKAHEATLNTLRKVDYSQGMMHSFRGHAQVGKRYIDRGLLLSLNSRSIRGKSPGDFEWLGISQFVIESDAPDLRAVTYSPEQWIAELNATASFLASTFQISPAEIWRRSQENLTRVFAIP